VEAPREVYMDEDIRPLASPPAYRAPSEDVPQVNPVRDSAPAEEVRVEEIDPNPSDSGTIVNRLA
jgi:hypothetical protein